MQGVPDNASKRALEHALVNDLTARFPFIELDASKGSGNVEFIKDMLSDDPNIDAKIERARTDKRMQRRLLARVRAVYNV